MHRVRGEILRQRDPADAAPAEQALQTAIAIAQHQQARSFELRAALSLAKLYRAANRDADAHAVLAPAVAGFPPTEQFPDCRRQANQAPGGGRLSADPTRMTDLAISSSFRSAFVWCRGPTRSDRSPRSKA
jgi:hypothetical protein